MSDFIIISDDEQPDFDHVVPLDAPAPVRWECGWSGCLNKGRWWRSAWGVVLCMNCRPPAWPDFVVEQGDASDAPLVDVHATSMALDPAARPDDPTRPLWILRGNRTPERVEAKEKRRKVEIPADATHWCHEGDREWIPFHRAKPPGAEPAKRRPVKEGPRDGLDFETRERNS